MKTKMTITVDLEVKQQFQQLAARMWSNVSSLTNMYFVSAVNTWNVRYYDAQAHLWEDLYQDYLNASPDLQADIISISTDSNDIEAQLSEKLWN